MTKIEEPIVKEILVDKKLGFEDRLEDIFRRIDNLKDRKTWPVWNSLVEAAANAEVEKYQPEIDSLRQQIDAIDRTLEFFE